MEQELISGAVTAAEQGNALSVVLFSFVAMQATLVVLLWRLPRAIDQSSEKLHDSLATMNEQCHAVQLQTIEALGENSGALREARQTLQRLSAVFVLGFLASTVQAEGFPRHVIPAEVVAIYDADTLTIDAHPWANETRRLKLRVSGVDTPEIRGKCPAERESARRARDLVLAWLGGQAEGRLGLSVALAEPIPVEILNPNDGKWAGRILGDLRRSDGASLEEFLLVEGLGRPYDGDARLGWCP